MKIDTNVMKKAFIILDRDHAYKKKKYYNMYVFKLDEDLPEKKILRYNQKPIFRGMVEFEKIGMEETSPIDEPYRFWKRINPPDLKNLKTDIEKNLKLLNPRLFKKMFVNAKFIATPLDTDLELMEPIFEWAKNYPVETRRYRLCDHCKKKKVFTLLGKDDYFIGFNKKKICKSCAGKEAFKILKMDYDLEISPQLKIILSRKLKKFKSVPKIIQMFANNFNPVTNSDLTIYDTKHESKHLLSKIRNLKPLPIRQLNIPEVLKEYYLKNNIEELLPIQTYAVKEGLLHNENLLVVSSTSSGKTLLGELAGFSKILENKMGKKPLPQKILKLNFKERKIALKSYFKQLRKINADSKMLYLVPIVALASLRFVEYKDLKRIGINPALKVGKSFMENESEEEFGKIKKSDIIIATYEALDVVLRSGGRFTFGNVDTIVIDEIQMLNDQDRGYVLDGMIARLKYLFPKAQFLFLSATISSPEILAKHYGCKLIEFHGRPVPMERHLVMMLNDFEKQKSMLLLAEEEFRKRSSMGFRGQSLVFTNSRRKCHSIAEFLTHNGVSAEAYHGGLTLKERRKIEKSFSKQFISTVVTTAALAAGVDFPASQVIFESLSMGIKWLTVAEFEQMCGRAGRYGKHNQAKAVILCEPGKSYHSGQLDTEEKVAVALLNGKIESIKLEPDEDKMFTEVLAFISMRSGYTYESIVNNNNANDNNGKNEFLLDRPNENKNPDLIAQFAKKMIKEGKIPSKQPKHSKRKKIKNSGTKKDIMEFQNNMFNGDFNLNTALQFLLENDMIAQGKMRPNGVHEICVTKFGKASAESFFPISQCIKIKKSLKTGENLFDLRDEELEYENQTREQKQINPYPSLKLKTKNPQKENNNDKDKQAPPHGSMDDNLPVMIAMELNPFKNVYLSKAVSKEVNTKGSKGSNLFFSNSTLSLLSAENLGQRRKLSGFLIDLLVKWTKEIFNCDCPENPYCNCGRRNIEKKIVEMRLNGKYPDQILKLLSKNWQIRVYMGDLIDYFDGFIHNLKSIYKIGRAIDISEETLTNLSKIPDIISNLAL